ncbi:MAG: hypothetical protein GC154_19695 [bacterium]|nr:hypothetical protein [bacterium]
MNKRRRSERGAALVMIAVCMTLFFIMLSFALDIGLMVSAKTELQNAADSASLAAAAQLADEDILTNSNNMSDDISEARNYAEQFAGYNKASKKALAIDRNDGNAAGGGVVVGYIDDPLSLSDTLNTGAGQYNSVEVKLELSSSINGPVNMLLGNFSGAQQVSVQARSTATLEDRIVGFSLGAGETLPMLPFAAYDGAWAAAIDGGQGPDNYKIVNGVVKSGSDGIPELTLYPYRWNIGVPGTRGNVGTIFVAAAINTGYVDNQIDHGMNQADLNFVHGLRFQPSGGGFSQWLPGENWMSSTWHTSLRGIRGQSRIMPLYDAISSSNPTAYADPDAFTEPMSDHPEAETCCSIQQYYMATEFKAVTVMDSFWPSNDSYKRFVVQPSQVVVDSGLVDANAPHSELVYTLSLTR